MLRAVRAFDTLVDIRVALGLLQEYTPNANIHFKVAF